MLREWILQVLTIGKQHCGCLYVVTDVKLDCCDHLAIYACIELSCYIPETNTMLDVSRMKVLRHTHILKIFHKNKFVTHLGCILLVIFFLSH